MTPPAGSPAGTPAGPGRGSTQRSFQERLLTSTSYTSSARQVSLLLFLPSPRLLLLSSATVTTLVGSFGVTRKLNIHWHQFGESQANADHRLFLGRGQGQGQSATGLLLRSLAAAVRAADEGTEFTV